MEHYVVNLFKTPNVCGCNEYELNINVIANDACRLYIWMLYHVLAFSLLRLLEEMYCVLADFNYSVWSTCFESVMSSVLCSFHFLLTIVSLLGSNYYVRILSTIDRELLKPNASVALHKHSNALVDVLPPEADSSIMMLTSGKTLSVTLSQRISGCMISRLVLVPRSSTQLNRVWQSVTVIMSYKLCWAYLFSSSMSKDFINIFLLSSCHFILFPIHRRYFIN